MPGGTKNYHFKILHKSKIQWRHKEKGATSHKLINANFKTARLLFELPHGQFLKQGRQNIFQTSHLKNGLPLYISINCPPVKKTGDASTKFKYIAL